MKTQIHIGDLVMHHGSWEDKNKDFIGIVIGVSPNPPNAIKQYLVEWLNGTTQTYYPSERIEDMRALFLAYKKDLYD